MNSENQPSNIINYNIIVTGFQIFFLDMKHRAVGGSTMPSDQLNLIRQYCDTTGIRLSSYEKDLLCKVLENPR